MTDPFKTHQRKIARDTMEMSDAGASIMGGMTKREAADFLFQEAYHSDKPGTKIIKFLHTYWDWEKVKSQHLYALLNQCRAVAGKNGDNIHPMIYGMMQEAWKCFLHEQYPIKTEVKDVTDKE